jgi:ribonuclease G
MIDYAEALTVIDVNTGSFTGKGKSARLEDTITKTNLEAAEEVVNQLRLRDIGGIIVIDFIDMARARNRDSVLKVLRKALDEDRTKTFVVEISPLGLVEMTRQNVTDGVREIMSKTCPVCHGEGVVKSEETIAIGIARHLRHMVAEQGKDAPEAYLLRINPKVSHWFTADGARELHALEEQTGRYFHFEGSEGLPLDHFAVTQEGTRTEIEERAVPFRAGEEVHVHIVEPHMYNPDDGVAKIDGYLIDVVNGIAFVGEKKLVRIEQAGRTSAVAALTGADAEAAEEAAKEREEERKRVDERAKRSAAAKRGAAARRAREDEEKQAKAKPAKKAKAKPAKAKPAKRRRRGKAEEDGTVEADAVQALADDAPAEAGTAPAAADEASENGDALSSRPRRRGRRGGRRRSRAKAAADE